MANLLVPQSDNELQAILNSHMSDNKLVVIDFNATWCGPCKVMAPILEEESRKRPHVIFISADVDKCPRIASERQIASIPNFHFLKNGQTLTSFSGVNKELLLSTLDTHGKGEERPLFNGAGHKLTDDTPSTVDQETLSMLTEMGFSRDIAYQALLERKTLDGALEWIDEYQSSHQPQPSSQPQPPQPQSQQSLGAEKKKDDVDDDVVMEDAHLGPEKTNEKKKEEEEEECKFDHNCFCDDCYEAIVGILYKCVDCDQDLCQACFDKHDKTHNITKNNGSKVVKLNESFTESAGNTEIKKEEDSDKTTAKMELSTSGDVVMEGNGNGSVGDAAVAGVPPEGEYAIQYFCDGCSKEIKGVNRYRCETCDCYDLCEECYKKNIHDPTHKFKEFRAFTLENYKEIMAERRQQQAVQREKEAQEKELRRIKEGKAAQDNRERAQELRRKRDDEIRKREYEEQKRYEIEVLRKIERDRQERLKRLNPNAAAAAAANGASGGKSEGMPAAKIAPQKVYAVSKSASSCTVARLKIRLPDGTTLTNNFDPDASLKTVFFWVQERYSSPTGMPFCFKCLSPNAHFTFAQMDITLRQARLVPSAVIIVTNK